MGRAEGGRGLRWPLPSSKADWTGVAGALGRAGQVMGRVVYRVGFPRSDLRVTSYGVQVKAGLALGSYVAFSRYGDGRSMVMGDLVVTEAELQRVTDALHANGLGQTGIHKHLLEHTPPLWWSHVHGVADDVVALARAVRAALEVTGTPIAAARPAAGKIDLDTHAVDSAMGARGKDDHGIYRFSFKRRETIVDHDRVVAPEWGRPPR